MTNYKRFPHWRKYGIVMKYNEYRYSLCDNNQANRKYLIDSDYCFNGIEFYVWENDKTYTSLVEFKKYLQDRQIEEAKEVCPLCGGKILVRMNKFNGEPFIGCENYPECKFTKRA